MLMKKLVISNMHITCYEGACFYLVVNLMAIPRKALKIKHTC